MAVLVAPSLESIMRTQPDRAVRPWRWLAFAGGLLAVTVAVYFRLAELNNLPGVNGDEAWMGVQALRLLHGEPVWWRTPTGNPLNPFLFLPQVALHAFFAPSFWLLRITTAMCGVLALVVNYLFCRRTFDERTAILSTLVLAALPINIAYSRFAWDSSQSLLATLPVVYLPLLAIRRPERFGRYLFASLCALVAAVLVHPTNVFVAPLPVIVLAMHYRSEMERYATRYLQNQQGKLAFLAFILAPVIAVRIAAPQVAGRLVDVAQASEMLLSYMRLLSGTTTYFLLADSSGEAYIGQGSWSGMDLLSGFIIGLAVWQFAMLVRSRRDAIDVALALGALAIAGGFYLVAGPRGLQPHFERYGMCLIGLSALVFARGVCHAIWQGGRTSKIAQFGFATVIGSLLLGFYLNYWAPIHATGGRAHYAFRTAHIEPKQQALAFLAQNRTASQPLHIITSDWWNYWPAAYLAYAHPGLTVSWPHGVDQPYAGNPFSQRNQTASAKIQYGFIGFANEPDANALRIAVGAEFDTEVGTFLDYSGNATIRAIFTTRKKAAE